MVRLLLGSGWVVVCGTDAIRKAEKLFFRSARRAFSTPRYIHSTFYHFWIMNTSHDREDISLLQLVVNYELGDYNRSICDDVLKWFEHSTRIEAQIAAGETNDCGETVLHIILKKYHARNEIGDVVRRFTAAEEVEFEGDANLLDVVKKFVEIAGDTIKMQDSRGYLPLHNACQDRACGFDVIQALTEAYPAGLGVMSTRENALTHTPFGWDYATSVGGHFTDFLQYVVATDVSLSCVEKFTMETRVVRHRLLGHCKNWVPLDILKKGMLNERNLESKAMIRWLNEMPCTRKVVCSMVFEFYLHMAWIATFVYTTMLHIEADQNIQGWEPIALLVFAAIFFIQEFYQLYRFIMTNAAFAYWLDKWNWIDLTTSSLVVASAIKFLQNDGNVQNDHDLLITTGFFQLVLLISYLKKTFFPFSKFVSGVIKVSSCSVAV